MAFQFECPQGHLLEGNESQAHQQINCPQCGILFIIPAPPDDDGRDESSSVNEHIPNAFPDDKSGFPQVGPRIGPRSPNDSHVNPSAVAAVESFEQAASPTVFHIPCPNGHELDAPADMLNQDVLCPHCNVQFRLRERDSVEYKRKKRLEQERRDHRAGKVWMNWAIVIAVLVVISLVILAFSSR